MDVLIVIGLLILGCFANFIWEPDARTAIRVARVYVALAASLAAAAWLFYFAGIKNSSFLTPLNMLIRYGGYFSRLLLGFLVVNVMFKVWTKDAIVHNGCLKALVRTALWGISIAIGNSFIVATVGKSMNMPYMIGFFKQSGYALWFLYFIMAAEAAGALGILLHIKLKTGIPATIGLMLIMLGAVYTHLHNRDPFSDSYDAVNEFIFLSLLLVVYFFDKQIGEKGGDTQIYVI